MILVKLSEGASELAEALSGVPLPAAGSGQGVLMQLCTEHEDARG